MRSERGTDIDRIVVDDCHNSNRQPMVLINNDDYLNGIHEHIELMTTMQHSGQ